MTPAEQRVLDAARAFRDNAEERYDVYARHRDALLYAAVDLPRTWPPPTVTANPAEVVRGEVRWDGEPYTVSHFRADGMAAVRWHDCTPGRPLHPPHSIAIDRLVSRPGVTL